MNIKIQTTWWSEDLRKSLKYVKLENFETLWDLEIFARGAECERLWRANNWMSIKVINEDKNKLILGTDISGRDFVLQILKFIKLVEKEYKL